MSYISLDSAGAEAHLRQRRGDSQGQDPWMLEKWVWVNTYRYIFSGMNIHLPAILGFTRYQGFDPIPNDINEDP